MAVIDSGTLLVLAGTLVGVLMVKKLLKMLTGPKLPPGPFPLPLIGNLLQLAARPKQPHITFHELAQKYGDIFTVCISTAQSIVLNSHELCTEVFVKNADAFSNRPMTYSRNIIYENRIGLVFHEGDIWKGIRRVALSSFRDFGLGKKSMEGKIQEEGSAMVDVIAGHDGRPFNPLQIMMEASINFICSISFGSRFEYTDEEFRTLTYKFMENMDITSLKEPMDYVPILRWLPLPANMKLQLSNLNDIRTILQSKIEDHRVSFDKDNLRDLVDLYLDNEKECRASKGLASQASIVMVIYDLFFAGAGINATSMQWVLLYLIHYPEIQARLHKEMEEAVGNERQPCLADRANLNYLQAFIMETLRCGSPAYATLPHLCTTEQQIGGYTIPKGATVLGNLYSINMSERYWKNPTQFNPDRFLDTNGKLMNAKEGFMPFGIGPRVCISESLARSQLFIFLACLIQEFTFKPADENNLPPLLGKAAITLNPEPFMIRAISKK